MVCGPFTYQALTDAERKVREVEDDDSKASRRALQDEHTARSRLANVLKKQVKRTRFNSTARRFRIRGNIFLIPL